MEKKHHISEDILDGTANSVEPSPNYSCLPETSCEQTVMLEALSHNLPTDRNIYREDVVRHIDHSALLGVVVEVAGDSDSEGSITDESDIIDTVDENNANDGVDVHNDHKDDENSADEDLTDGQVRVLWTNGSESTDNIYRVKVVDRRFMHGDVIASLYDSAGQLALVEDVSITVNLQTYNGEIIPNISTKSLKRIREFSIGDYAILGPWLGRVDDVFDNVTVLFNDGSICKVVKADPLRLKAVSRPVTNDANSPFYPGQQVRAISSSVFKNSRWLSGSWKAGRLEGTVIKVQTASVMVYWMTSAHLGAGTASDGVPSEEQDPKNLTPLSCFLHTNWQLGDWCFLGTPENLDSFDQDSIADDKISEQVSAVAQNSSAYRKKVRKVMFKRERKAGRKSETFERALLIVSIMTKVDVTWQNGTRENGLESTSLIPIRSESDHEFFPKQYVVEKSMNELDDLSESNRVGIVKGVNSKERTVCVRWFKPVSSPDEPREIMCEEIVSVYELEEHPDYDYCYGDVVVRLSPALAETSSENVHEQPADPAESEKCATTKNLECNPDMSKSEAWAKFRSLSWVGNITGLQDGDVEVAWADGMVSNISPQDIYVVGRDDDEGSYEGGSEISDGGASWETATENEMDMLEDTEKEEDPQNALSIPAENTQDTLPVSEDNSPELTGAISASLAAINFVTRLATGWFSRNKKPTHASNSDHNGTADSETQDAPEVAANGTTNTDLELSDRRSSGDDAERVDDGLSNGLVSRISGSGVELQDDIDEFKHFDICDSPADHFFISSCGQGSGGKKWVKKIQQEWSILEKNLPDAIYVRAYEDRMDLLRAVIVGASGTPYQDGLYFFDFYLPPDYPQVPPLAHYHSGGLRLNPNLYIDGKVCLSLLNTWAGRGNEVWDPPSSSILQVLVSLQGLVLNSKPYFNEAGYEKQVGTIEGEKNSIPYNENSYLMNLKSMMYLMRRPPLHFESFVKKHFQKRGNYILRACEAYMGGSLIGTLSKDACPPEKSNKEHFSSVGFKLMLSKIMPKLMAAMAEIGSNVRQFEHLISSENRR